jgi:hypothetical protein
LVTVELLTPVAVFVAVTLTPGILACVVSCTTPVSVPIACPKALPEKSASVKSNAALNFIFSPSEKIV